MSRVHSALALGVSRAEGEGEMMVNELVDLEEMALKLQDKARRLPPGPDRHALLQEIGRFRVQISLLRHAKTDGRTPSPIKS